MSAVTTPKSAQDRAAEQAAAALRKLGGEQFREEAVVFDGQKVVLPAGSTLKSNIDFLARLEKEEGETASWARQFKFRPIDGIVALQRALKEAFGAIRHQGAMSFFGPNPPQLLDVDVSLTEKEQVPYFGNPLSVAAIDGVTFVPAASEHPELGQVFTLFAEGPKSKRFEVEGLFNLVERHLQERSIYKGQAITAGFEFIDISKVKPDQVIYSEQVMFELERSVWGPIELDDELTEAGIDLKGAVLLHGPFGTGKTLASYLTGQRAVANGWTYIVCGPEHDLFDALRAAKQYAPSIVFYEDVDVITADADAERIQQLLDAFDGIRRKGEAVRVVLTSNYPEKIHKGLVRPGRIDAVIEIGKPDAQAIRKLVSQNCPHLDSNIDEASWDAVTDAMEGYLPAYVVEATERAYMAALMRSKRQGGEAVVGSEDLRLAAESLAPQLALMEGASEVKPNDRLEKLVGRIVEDTVHEVVETRIDPRLVQPRP